MTTHPDLMFYGIYEDDFALIRLYCEVFWSIMDEEMPALASRIKELNIPDELWIFQWFLCFYIYSFPIAFIKPILTFVWEHKELALVKLAVAIMKILEPKFTTAHKTKFED